VPSVAAATGLERAVTVAETFELMTPGLGWADLERLVAECGVPVLLKGVLAPEDARRSVEHGVAGVIVSNHGGRQLDRTVAAGDALPEIVEEVGGRAAVLVDGGIRRGVDVAIALALGADAVLVGRAPIWGLAAAGEEGARRVLEILREELELALALCRAASPAALDRGHALRAPATSVYSVQ
jgi:4-hydroxymandelate oxidase